MPALVDILRALVATPAPTPSQPVMRAPTPRERLIDAAQSADEWMSAPVRGLASLIGVDPGGHLAQMAQQGTYDRATAGLSPSQLQAGILNGTIQPPTLMGEAKPNGTGEALMQVLQRIANPIKAFHGSPHEFAPEPGAPLGRFRADKIGTGEGAQAYGHGHYVAGVPDVSRGYRDMVPVTDRPGMGRGAVPLDTDMRIGGRPVTDVYSEIERRAARMSPKDAEPLYERLSALESLMQHGDILGVEEAAKAGQVTPNAFAWMTSEVTPKFTRRGKLYEVAIHADPASFLDLDKPLSQQPNVREALKKVFGYDWPTEAPAATGKEVVSVGQMKLGGPGAVESKLRDAGVSGAMYLDQGSRAAGEGSHNYVVFPGNEHLIEILRKYGLLPFAAGLGAAQAQGQSQ